MSFTQRVMSGASADGEYVYYNATIINNTVATTQATDDPTVYFQDTRQYPLIKDTSQYVVSVDNFSINGAQKTLPILIPQMIGPQQTGVVLTSAIASGGGTGTGTGTGTVATTVTYTFTSWAVALTLGQSVTVTGFSNTAYNVTGTVVSSTATTFTIANATTSILQGSASVTAGSPVAAFQNYADINYSIYSVSFGLTVGTTVGSGTGTTATTQSFVATIPLTWINENQAPFTVKPLNVFPRQPEVNYYYLYSYSHWVDIMNNALTTAWKTVMTQANQIQGVGGTRCPYFEYDQNTGLFSLVQDALTSWLPYGQQPTPPSSAYSASQGVSDPSQPFGPFFPTNTYYGAGQGTGTGTGSGTGTSGAVAYSSVPYGASEFSFVGYNSNLEGLISNFDTIYFGGQSKVLSTSASSYSYTQSSTSVITAPASAAWVAGNVTPVYYPENIVNVVPQANSIFTMPTPWSSAFTTSIYYLRETEDFISTGSLWSPIASLVLTTTQIPIRLEGNANPVLLGASNTSGATGLSGASQKVLLETPIDAVTADLWRGFILYKPLVPLFSALDPSEGGLTNIDLRLGWRNRLTNEVIPIQMYNSGTVSFRLRFVKK